MQVKLWPILGMVLVIAFAGWGASAASIGYAARQLTVPQSCVALIHLDYAGFLVSNGQRSVPALHREFARPDLGLGGKMRIAEVLGRIGDHSRFGVFLHGLGASRHQNTAAWRMEKFPEECFQRLPAILEAGRQKQKRHYWDLLMFLARERKLPEDREEELLETLSEFNFEKTLTAQDVRKLRAGFGV